MQNMYRAILAFIVSLILPLTISVAEEKKEEAQKPKVFSNVADRLTIDGYVQLQFSTSSVDDVVNSSFEIRRARLGAIATFNDWITGRFLIDAAAKDNILRDAYLNLEFDPGFQLRFGQFKKPFSRIQLISASMTPVIERGIRIRGVSQKALDDLLQALRFSERDIGVIALGTFKGAFGKEGSLAYQAGVFNGEGRNTLDINDGKLVNGRLIVIPRKGLEIAFSASNNTLNGDPIKDSTGNPVDSTNVQAFGFDAQYRPNPDRGIWLIGEVDLGDNFDDKSGGFLRGDDTASFLGFLAIATYRIPIENNKKLVAFEPVFRIDFTDPDRDKDDDAAILVTPGFNLYF